MTETPKRNVACSKCRGIMRVAAVNQTLRVTCPHCDHVFFVEAAAPPERAPLTASEVAALVCGREGPKDAEWGWLEGVVAWAVGLAAFLGTVSVIGGDWLLLAIFPASVIGRGAGRMMHHMLQRVRMWSFTRERCPHGVRGGRNSGWCEQCRLQISRFEQRAREIREAQAREEACARERKQRLSRLEEQASALLERERDRLSRTLRVSLQDLLALTPQQFELRIESQRCTVCWGIRSSRHHTRMIAVVTPSCTGMDALICWSVSATNLKEASGVGICRSSTQR